MKITKLISLIMALVMCLAMGFTGCDSSKDVDLTSDETGEYSFPTPNITLNGEVLEYASVKNNTMETDFSVLVADTEPTQALIGDIISVEFPTQIPVSAEVTDVLLTSEGINEYDEDYTNDITSNLEGNVLSFEIPVNAAVYLDLGSELHAAGRSFRGFKVLADFGSYNMEYTFVLDVNIEM